MKERVQARHSDHLLSGVSYAELGSHLQTNIPQQNLRRYTCNSRRALRQSIPETVHTILSNAQSAQFSLHFGTSFSASQTLVTMTLPHLSGS
jgi:hypothetical protein